MGGKYPAWLLTSLKVVVVLDNRLGPGYDKLVGWLGFLEHGWNRNFDSISAETQWKKSKFFLFCLT